MDAPYALGGFTNQTRTLDFEFYFSHEPPNIHQKTSGILRFAFSAAVDGLSDNTDMPDTGDKFRIDVTFMILSASAGALVLIYLLRRKRVNSPA